MSSLSHDNDSFDFDAYFRSNSGVEQHTSRAEKEIDLLPFGDIGGVGQFVYRNFRFSDYRFEPQDNGDTMVVPILDDHTPLETASNKKLDGTGILTSLYDLATKIDSFETKENYAQLIVQWCVDNMHPYNIDTLYDTLIGSDKIDDPALISEISMQDGAFSLQQFVNNLGSLYNAVRMKRALDGVAVGDEDYAYGLYECGRFFEAPSFFEKYKHPIIDIPDDLPIEPPEDTEDNELLREMRADSKYMSEQLDKMPPASGHFAQEPFDDYEQLRYQLLDMFPDFRLRLKVDPADGKVALAAVVDSVFDIAWYALAHLITEEPTLDDLGRRSKNLKGIMETCRNCGRLFIRYSSRNHYCDREECQKARNAQNQRAFRQRRAARKTQSKDQPASAENA